MSKKLGPHKLDEYENVWILMQDGCRLAARLWLPKSAAEKPVSTIIEYIPYRKRDFTAVRDSSIHRFFASHGYACLRVDLRGSGDSGGVLRDEYLQQELDDGCEIMAWIAAQAWSDGSVGIIGLSWGGFNGLQLAAMRPPQLKAVISVCASDERYADDVHYMGGCMLTDNLSWASTMLAYTSCPPDPELVGERWREMWLERLSGSGLWIKNWLEHQRYDDYWKHASVCENYEAIECPVFIVSGWADGYSDTVFRLLKNLKSPCKGLVGAWGHKYPQHGDLSPAIGFLSESLRWWDRWLRGEQTGVEDEPRLRAWMQHSVSPTARRKPGRWIAEETWPSPHIQNREFLLNPEVLVPVDEGRAVERELSIQSPLSVGLFAGKWMSYGLHTDTPSDQREEDGGALIFETTPLTESLEVLGKPLLELVVSSDKPVAQIVARISDVRPDGKVTRATFGMLNLTHRESRESPTPVDPGKRYPITVELNRIGQSFPKGHRIRVSLSTSYWPMVWPAPEPAHLQIVSGQSRLVLPTREPRAQDRNLRRLGSKDGAAPLRTTLLSPAKREWTVQHDMATMRSTLRVVNQDETRRIEDYDWEFGRTVTEEYSYVNYNYDTVCAEITAERHFGRVDWRVRAVTRTVLTSSRTHFRLRATLDAYEGDARIFATSWDERIPRDQL